MNPRPKWRRWLAALALATLGTAPLVVPQLTPAAQAAAKTVWIPERWQSTGEVPWAQDRTRESANFILLWGERSGRRAPSSWRCRCTRAGAPAT